MILQALAQRYYDTALEENAVPFGWAKRDAAFALDLDENGVLYNLMPLDRLEGKKRVRQAFLLPEEPAGRTVAIKPAFLCDNSKYIFGISEKANGRDKKCFEASKSLHIGLLEDVDSPAARAIVRFFENWDTSADYPVLAPLLVEKTTADIFFKGRFVFQVNGRFAQDDYLLQQAWEEVNATQEGEQICCLVSGKNDKLIRLHGKISLPGVSMGSVPLVSINAESFASYGKSKDDPASPIGEQSAFAYATALNALLKEGNHHKRLGSDTLLYWGEKGGEPEAAAFSWIGDPKEEDELKLAGIMEKFSRGDKLELDNCVLERPFYLLCLSPNAGRISVRFFYQESFENMLRNNLEHYRNLEIAMSQNEKFHYLPPWVILSETTTKKQAGDAAPLLGGQLMQSILSGSNYPMTLYYAILTRIRAGEKINRTKAAIIKAALIRNYPKKSEGITVSLNEQLNKTPYVLGRLFAVLEWVQQRSADGQLNATIRDKYFSSACANPGSTFPILLKLSVHHIAKLNNSGYFEKLKGQLIDKLDGSIPFPTALNMEDQGQFIVGYYHQIQYFYTPRKDKEENDND